MSLYLDIGVGIIILIAMLVGWRRGVARALIRLVGAIGSLFLSSYLANLMAPYVFETMVRPSLTGKVEQVLAAGPAQDAAQKLRELFEAMPQFVSSSLAQYGITNNQLEGVLTNTSGDTAKALVDAVSPVVIDPIRMVLVIVLFAILMLLVGFAARAIGRIFRLPVLRQADALLGLVFGLCTGLLILLVACLVVRAVVPMVDAGSFFARLFSPESIEGSALFRILYQINPFYR